MRIPVDQMVAVLHGVLRGTGMTDDRADLCARLFVEASRDGVASHGLNRFPRFVRMITRGIVDVHASPEKTSAAGALERWAGRAGPGNLNAHACMARAIEVARVHGISCVALSNTNHWMRGGAYGWQAAEAGLIGVCWTNTLANVPPWGSAEPRIGNNPVVIAVARPAGHVVLDMAMSQFSVGALTSYAARGEALPVDGGYDSAGNLTRDAAAIAATGRLLPIGFWKGSGLALMLDLLAAALSGGRATHEIAADPELETALSQVFIAIDPSSLAPQDETARIIDAAIAHLHAGDEHVRHPAQRTLETRARSIRDGVPVDPAIWAEVKALAAG